MIYVMISCRLDIISCRSPDIASHTMFLGRKFFFCEKPVVVILVARHHLEQAELAGGMMSSHELMVVVLWILTRIYYRNQLRLYQVFAFGSLKHQ